jgi:hypothetical protein
MSVRIHVRRNSKPKKLKTLRVDRIEILNQNDGLYYTLECRMVDGVPTLRLSEMGKD